MLFLRTFVCALFIGVLTTTSTLAALPQEEQCQNKVDVEPVVIVARQEGRTLLGSGVWIQTDLGDNYFATNAHVVTTDHYTMTDIQTTDPTEIEQYTAGGTFHILHKNIKGAVKATVVSIVNHEHVKHVLDPQQTGYYRHTSSFADVAILKVENMPAIFTESLTQHKLSTSSDMPKRVQASGYEPNAQYKPIKYDLCRDIAHDSETIHLLDEHGYASGGASGSPLVNNKGEIVGLIALTGKLFNPDEFYTVSHMENGKLYTSKASLHPNTSKTHSMATPVKWVHLALQILQSE